MRKCSVIEQLGNAHTQLTYEYTNDLISYESFNKISDLILEAQKIYRHNFDYDKECQVSIFKNRKEVKNETNQ